MAVHNHGSEEGEGLACNELRLPDGSRKGACLMAELDAVSAAQEVIRVWAKREFVTKGTEFGVVNVGSLISEDVRREFFKISFDGVISETTIFEVCYDKHAKILFFDAYQNMGLTP